MLAFFAKKTCHISGLFFFNAAYLPSLQNSFFWSSLPSFQKACHFSDNLFNLPRDLFFFTDPAYPLFKKLAIFPLMFAQEFLFLMILHILEIPFNLSGTSFLSLLKAWQVFDNLLCLFKSFASNKSCFFSAKSMPVFRSKLPVFDHPAFRMFKKIAKTFNNLFFLLEYFFSFLIRPSHFSKSLQIFRQPVVFFWKMFPFLADPSFSQSKNLAVISDNSPIF